MERMTVMGGRGLALFATVSVLWGIPYMFIDIALDDLRPVTIAAARVTIAALVLTPVLLIKSRWRTVLPRWRSVMVLAVIEVVVPFTLIALGQQTVPSGTTGVIIAMEPMFVAVLAPLLLVSARLRATGWAGLLLGLAGVVVLLGIDITGPGILLIVVAALAYALGAILLDRWFADVDSLVVASAMIMAATVPLILLAVFIDPAPRLTTRSVAALMVLGAACTAGGFATFFALIRRIGATRAALIAQVAPIVALGAGIVVLGEILTIWQAVSCVLILAGATLVLRPGQRP